MRCTPKYLGVKGNDDAIYFQMVQKKYILLYRHKKREASKCGKMLTDEC